MESDFHRNSNFFPQLSAEDIDSTVLMLFPTLSFSDCKSNRSKNIKLTYLSCIRVMGTCYPIGVNEISKIMKVPYFKVRLIMKKLQAIEVVKPLKERRQSYILTAKGVAVLTSLRNFREFERIARILTNIRYKDDLLAYALLIIGRTENDPLNFHSMLAAFAKQGCTFEFAGNSELADSLLQFYSKKRQSELNLPLLYLDLFKDFTPASFQDILAMIVSAIKPTRDDYNWLIQFFADIVEFYNNPIRIAYSNSLSNNSTMRIRLEKYKKDQELSAEKGRTEVKMTLRIGGSQNFKKLMNMPTPLRVMSLKLMLEPLQFMAKELKESFWPQ